MKKLIQLSIAINILIFSVLLVLSSCKKYLDEPPNKGTVIISKLSDLQAILDNPLMTSSYFSLATGSADEYYFTESTWDAKASDQKDAYIWKSTTNIDGWSLPYQIVFQANIVLSELEELEGSQSEKAKVKGQALFLRAFAFYHIAQIYSLPYSTEYLSTAGVALRTSPLISVRSVRSTVAETYEKIINDLKESASLLDSQKEPLNRPNKIGAYGALARVYLSMRDYANASKYAQLSLDLSTELIDFNQLDVNANPGISQYNEETSFYAYMEGFPYDEGITDTTLYNSYDESDLRKQVYFYDPGDGSRVFKGSYAGFYGNLTFCGIANDEIYLIRAECAARANDAAKAMELVNLLLRKRWMAGTFAELATGTPEEALEIVLKERRKELVYRGTRWTDIRRFNLEGRNITLKRVLNGITYELPANDNRIAWLIPNEVISLTGMEQNKR
ncbi:RagB/SusD family nutrient uptake outer membrane protein [Chitinophaga barathri]|uniref:RagB/SusD family nutrient uptake outer membrane protein n=1 Tax=Chitinophaga barathri TaxID=1647451 RepID=A0A3N4MV31_9BACT|nr:RagB/SusD family nutrient uptake outer membrane protein [Chitinophaga barathri]RPD39323.1 RagB/SusD family nutrient uptake outer membrane protein [Chitinophaga barathri]